MKLEEDPISIVDVDNNNLLPLGFDLVVDVGFDLSFTIQRIGLSTVTKGRKKEIKTKRTMTEATKNYVEEYLPASIIEKLEAGAYQSLCNHLRERSDEVQNIDLMTISGFCRNCLAKWLVVEARKLSDKIKAENGDGNAKKVDNHENILQALDAMGYDEAAQYVYGMNYGEWKKRHAKKASDVQMEKFNNSKSVWASHDKQVLAKRVDTPPKVAMGIPNKNGEDAPGTATGQKSSLLSNVCCQDVDSDKPPQSTDTPTPSQEKPKKKTRTLPPYKPPAPPSGISFSLGVLTISDRASSGQYETGDLSGPAVKDAVEEAIVSYNNSSTSNPIITSSIQMAIVPDEVVEIESKLKDWSDRENLNLILTTGGTGFSPRDVTPEATSNVIERSCEGLVTFCTMECAKIQPLASLSRGTAGTRGKSLIINLPGNPKGVGEIIPVLLPLALTAIADIQA